jgi:hypothetical protein
MFICLPIVDGEQSDVGERIGSSRSQMLSLLEIQQCMHECQKLDLFDLDTKLMTSVGPVYKQQETSSRYCVANDNLCNVRRYCKLLMLPQPHLCLPCL